MEKTVVRKNIRKILQKLTSDEIQARSSSISQLLFQTAWWKKANTVLAFCSMEGEVDTGEIINSTLSAAKTVGVPRVEGNDLVFHHIQSLEEDFCSGCFGIREPEASLPVLNPSTLNPQNVLIIAPGLAFDRKKNRLGRGKGFYDCFLQYMRRFPHLTITVIGICFSEQVLAEVPVGTHDQPVDGVITEREVL